jgi:hypothetical protein
MLRSVSADGTSSVLPVFFPQQVKISADTYSGKSEDLFLLYTDKNR